MRDRIHAATGAAALAMVLSAGAAVMAQTRTQPTELGTITVIAPRITYQMKREPGSAVPMEVTTAEKSAQVKFDDLDLTRTGDLYRLEERVRQAAATVCEELAQQFPDGEPSTEVCTRRATDDALAQVRMVAQQTNASGP